MLYRLRCQLPTCFVSCVTDLDLQFAYLLGPTLPLVLKGGEQIAQMMGIAQRMQAIRIAATVFSVFGARRWGIHVPQYSGCDRV
jgi:hypothetical protein